jgi:tRNA G18 (ribose-2'-O)-methylase SpoU
VLERVGNADNVGAIFRNAAAFGADGVLLDTRSTDPFYRKAIRTSMAATLQVPFARTADWPGALDRLRQHGVSLLAMTPAPDAPPLRDVAGLAHARLAIVVGHEGDGLTDEAIARCDRRARIPIAPGVDSLNVATAVAVALYELSRMG